jgi:hypothetical protein
MSEWRQTVGPFAAMVDGSGSAACCSALPGRLCVRTLANVPEARRAGVRRGARDEQNEQANMLRLAPSLPEHKREGCAIHGARMRARSANQFRAPTNRLNTPET